MSIFRAMRARITSLTIENRESQIRLGFNSHGRQHTFVFEMYQKCCEHRWFDSEDDLSEASDADLLDISLRECVTPGDEPAACFLVLDTDKGAFTIKAYNDHNNGAYAGFDLVLRSCEPAA